LVVSRGEGRAGEGGGGEENIKEKGAGLWIKVGRLRGREEEKQGIEEGKNGRMGKRLAQRVWMGRLLLFRFPWLPRA
jgi:hypothetical protein